MLAFVAGLPLTGQCYTNWELAKELADDKPTFPDLSGEKLSSCRPSARNLCEPTGRTQTIHWKWAPHRLIA